MGSLLSSLTGNNQPTTRQPIREQNSRTISVYAPRTSTQINQPSSRSIYEYTPRTSPELYQSPYRYSCNNINTTYILQQNRPLRPNASLQLYRFLLSVNSWQELEPLSTYRLKPLDSNSSKYEQVNDLFRQTTQRHFKVQKICEVQNPFMLGFYLLKKEEMMRKYRTVDERWLFHGTRYENINNIIENNLNWRLHGQSRGHIFGQGVSFTPISCYASNYSDKYTDVKVMILAKVLVSQEAIGDRNMIIPPLLPNRRRRYDTTIKPNGQVLVKYSDNEFYPYYIIYYTGQQIKTVRH